MAQLEPVPAKTRLSQDGGMVTTPWERWLRNLRRRIRELGTLSKQNANDVTIGDLSVTGALDVAGATTLGNNLTIDRSGDAASASITLNADSSEKQSLFVTDGSGAIPAVEYDRSTDAMQIGSDNMVSIDFANAPLTVQGVIEWNGGDTTVEYDGSSLQFVTTDFYRWSTDAGAEFYIYNGGVVDTYAPNSSATGNLLNMRSDVWGTASVAFRVKANGDVQSQTNSYGAISDARLKENITDAPSQWDDVMRIRFRHYNMIGSDLRQLGVVAQELQAAGMGGLVSEGEDGTLSVKTSVLTMKALVALQEAMRRIEALETQLNGES